MRLSEEKLDQLRRVFVLESLSPGLAAKRVGISTATANRYFEKWGKEIAKAREQLVLPQLKQSLLKFSQSKAKSVKPIKETTFHAPRHPVRPR